MAVVEQVHIDWWHVDFFHVISGRLNSHTWRITFITPFLCAVKQYLSGVL